MTRFVGLIAGWLVGSVLLAESPAENLLWFDAPAAHCTQSCPLGNGRLGASVVDLQLNSGESVRLGPQLRRP